MLISIKTHITCDFPEGSGPPVPLLDPRMFEQSLPLEVSSSIPESLSLPLDVRIGALLKFKFSKKLTSSS